MNYENLNNLIESMSLKDEFIDTDTVGLSSLSGGALDCSKCRNCACGSSH